MRVGREVWERVARVPGDDPTDEATVEEERAETRERQHDELEPGVPTPPLTDDLTRRGTPAGVADHEVQGVAGEHMTFDGFAE